MRSSGSVVLSLIVAFVLVVAVEGISSVLHPFPPGFEGTSDEIIEHVTRYPVWVLAFLGVVGWGGTMFISTWLATRLGARRHPAHGFGVGSLLLLAVIYNMYHLPYPIWFVILDLVVLSLGIYYGTKMGGGERSSN